MDSFSWLHLTDLHFGLEPQGWLWPTLREPWWEDLQALHERTGPWQAVLFTGDLVQSGTSAQFRAMKAQFLDLLWERLRDWGSGDARLLAVPGNHDLFRPRVDGSDAAAERLVEEDFSRVSQKFWAQPDGPYRKVVSHAFGAWTEWWEQEARRGPVSRGMLPGDFAATVEVGDRRIGIMGLNTAWLQLGGGDYKGRLQWDARQVSALCPSGVDQWTAEHDVALLLTHHGPDWLSEAARAHGESEVAPAGRFAAHLFGHAHTHKLEWIRRGGSARAQRLVQGASVFGLERFGETREERLHGYAVGRLTFGADAVELRLWPRIATRDTGRWRFIPDHLRAELRDDQGTEPERFPLRKQRPAPAVQAAPPPSSAPAASVVRSNLPSRRPFFGRVEPLQQIERWLRPEDRSWGVLIDGPGGFGKTALALEVAHQAPAERFPLKLWVTAKTSALSPEGPQHLDNPLIHSFTALMDELGRALDRPDVGRAPADQKAALVRQALVGTRALLVLDNLESMNSTERRRVLALLDSLPEGCRAIVTSRRRDSSHGGHALRLDQLEEDAALELLAELGRHNPALGRLSEADRALLIQETGGNPLMLTWTAGQLGRVRGRARTVAEAVERLRLAGRHPGGEEENDALAFIFGDLIETFTRAEVQGVAALTHFSGPAKLGWLLPMVDVGRPALERALDDLRDRALLVEDEVAATWLLPPLAARFVKRTRPEVVAACGARLADDVFALVMEHGWERHERFPVLEEAWPRIEAALPVLMAGENRRAQRVCNALDRFLDFSGRWDARLVLNRQGEAAALVAGDVYYAGWRAYRVGRTLDLLGDLDGLRAAAERAQEHWEQSRVGARERSIAIRMRGWAHEQAGEHDEAIKVHEEVLALRRSLDPKSTDVAIGLNNLAIALKAAGRLDEAEQRYREALTLAKTWTYEEGVATYTGNLAALALEREHWPEAEHFAMEALERAEVLGYQKLIASNCDTLASALAHQGRAAEGLPYAQRAVEIFTRLRSRDLAEAEQTLAFCKSGL